MTYYDDYVQKCYDQLLYNYLQYLSALNNCCNLDIISNMVIN